MEPDPMDAMNRRKALGVVAGGLAATGVAGQVAAGQQAKQSQKDPKISQQELKDLHEQPSPPPERDQGKEPTEVRHVTFVSSNADIFMIAHRHGGVILNLRGEVAANQANVTEDDHFYYLTMSTSTDLPRFAIAKKAGMWDRHQVWSRHGAGGWTHYERAAEKRLEGNLVVA